MSLLRMLMPPRARLAGQAVSPELGKALARADIALFSPLPISADGVGKRVERSEHSSPLPNPDPGHRSGDGARRPASQGLASVPTRPEIGRGAKGRRDPSLDVGLPTQDQQRWRAPLQRAFDILPRGLPVAALTRAVDAPGDADGFWLRADPAFVRADMATGRLMAWSELGLSAAEAQALIAPLRPLFGDEGLLLDAPHPARWYLRLPERVELPDFSDPFDALGDDLREHLPQGSHGRRWLRLLTEAQVLLHNHPLNLERQRQGQPPVNSLWFWGAGTRPHQVATRFAAVQSDEPLLRALGIAAGAELRPPAVRYEAHEGDHLLDLRDAIAEAVRDDWLLPALAALRGGRLTAIELDFPDADGLHLQSSQRWRIWRRAWTVWA
jgi:hypothetical protein